MRHLPRPHPHIRPQAVPAKRYPHTGRSWSRSKDGSKTIGATLTPVGIVIPGNDITGLVQTVKKNLGLLQLRIRSNSVISPVMITNFSRALAFDISYGRTQVIRCGRSAADMRIGNMCEFEKALGRRPPAPARRGQKIGTIVS